MNRREFLLRTFGVTSLVLIPNWLKASSQFAAKNLKNSQFIAIAPLEFLKALQGNSEVEGDVPDDAHEIFWNRDGYLGKKGGIPGITEHYDVIVVGGGMAGLSSAYQLAGKKILVIDGNPRFGGNSRSQAWGNNYVSQGAAYITLPEEGDEIDSFLGSLGLNKSFRHTTDNDEPVIFRGKIMKGFWKGATDPARAPEFIHFKETMLDINENYYPELPCWDDSLETRKLVNDLDKFNFLYWLNWKFPNLHPHILEWVQMYCWASFGTEIDEISAAQGLNFLACDLAGSKVLPGGNGLITHAVFDSLKKRSGVTLEANSFCVDIRAEGGKSVVCYKTSSGNLKTVSAPHCIVAAPKFVSKKIISTLSQDQFKAMNAMTYRAYLVGNIILKRRIQSVGYDTFNLNGLSARRTMDHVTKRVYADVVCADWAMGDRGDKSALTLYMPLPYDMAQQYLFVPGLYEKYQDRAYSAIEPFMSGLGLNRGDIEGMRLVRYGHALPVAAVNGISSGIFEKASASIDGCIHFANQDNWGNPAFETSFGCALRAVEKALN